MNHNIEHTEQLNAGDQQSAFSGPTAEQIADNKAAVERHIDMEIRRQSLAAALQYVTSGEDPIRSIDEVAADFYNFLKGTK